MGGEPYVVATILTYKRRELLKRCLNAVITQSRRPDAVLVVDNGGEARRLLDGMADVEIVETGENLGPAGGYAMAFGLAMERGADKIWTVDDDVLPNPDCLEKLLSGSKGVDVAIPLQRKPNGWSGYPPSWNGVLFDSGVVAKIGLPRADFFFWAEDTEYYWRLREAQIPVRKVAATAVLHVNPEGRSRGQARNWHIYYEVRNTLYYRLRLRPFGFRNFYRAVASVMGKAAAILLFEPRKQASLRLWWKAIRDFRQGRMGKIVDPEAWLP